MNTHTTRESWMNAFTEAARPIFEEHGYDIPPVRMSIGFTSKGARGSRIGECWSNSMSGDGVHEIFVTPLLGDASRIADILTHELIHAAVGIAAGHKKPFVDAMKKLGLSGKPTATVAGAGWHEWADPILDAIGPLPHSKLKSGESAQQKQSTRMLKCSCPKCGFVMRTSAKWLEAVPQMRCVDPQCETELEIG